MEIQPENLSAEQIEADIRKADEILRESEGNLLDGNGKQFKRGVKVRISEKGRAKLNFLTQQEIPNYRGIVIRVYAPRNEITIAPHDEYNSTLGQLRGGFYTKIFKPDDLIIEGDA